MSLLQIWWIFALYCTLKHSILYMRLIIHNLILMILLTLSFTGGVSRYAALVVAPYPWDFVHLGLDGWILEVGEMILSEKPPPWLDILAKSSLVNECVERACVRWRLHVFVINLEFFSPYLHSWILTWWSER